MRPRDLARRPLASRPRAGQSPGAAAGGASKNEALKDVIRLRGSSRRARDLVHRRIGEAVGVGVRLPPDVLERDAADVAGQERRRSMERLQAGVLHLEVAQHLLDEEQRIGAHLDLAMPLRARPLERREQPSILGDVVRRDADRLANEAMDEAASST